MPSSRRPALPRRALPGWLLLACSAAAWADGAVTGPIAIPHLPAFQMQVESGQPIHAAAGAGAASAPQAAGSAGASGPVRAPAASAPAGARDADADSFERLRRLLAEKLGATTSGDTHFVMKVANHGETGEHVISAARGGESAHRRLVAKARRGRAVPASGGAATAVAPISWDYSGPGGPDAWARLRPDYARCATGQRQSPIDIRGGIAVDLEPIRFDYHPSGFTEVDDGHTVRVRVAAGSSIQLGGRRYQLESIDFHHPSEERVGGRQYDMSVHLLHRSADGHVAMVAVLLDRGEAQPLLQSVLNNLPLEKHDEEPATGSIDPSDLLPRERGYYTYMGSLTTPPCTEDVLWLVLQHPMPVSPEQVDIFARLYPMNARPVQQAAGRLIKQSQ